MADDFDVEAMLEAPYKKEEADGKNDAPSEKDRSKKKRSRSRSRDRDRDRDRNRDRDRDRDRDKKRRDKDRDGDRDRKDRDRKRSRSKDKEREKDRKRSRSRDKERDRGGDRNRDRERDRDKDRDRRRRKSRSRERRSSPHRSSARRRSRSVSPIRSFDRRRSYSKSPIRVSRQPGPELTPEERDARTVFCMQLAARIRPRDLEEFFSSVGKVRDVRLIMDNKTRRSKGIAYIEFVDTDSVPLAIGLTNQKLLGVPIIVQPSQAEKNRLANSANILQKGNTGPMRLYVGSLHFNITEDMLKGIFEPFGAIEDIKLIRDHESNRSQGYGFISFKDSEDAKKALEQLNGFELAGRPMKVGHVTERTAELAGSSALDTDEMDRAGIDLGATGRLQLMAKLAEGTGFQIPDYAANALSAGAGSSPGVAPTAPGPAVPAVTGATTGSAQTAQSVAAPPIATQCFMLSNMFDPATESRPNWDQEIRDDVIEECNKHGGALHIYVDKASPQGNVYVKCPTIAAAVASVTALHGRFFGGKMITAAYVPLPNYHSLFSEAVRANQLLLPSSQALSTGFPTTMYQPTTAIR